MIKIYKFNDFQEINEISKEVIDRTSIEMRNRGQNTRASNLKNKYDNKYFAEFIDKPIFDDKIIYSIHFTKKYNNEEQVNGAEYLRISYGSSRDKEFNIFQGEIYYYIGTDVFSLGSKKINRKDARLLSSIARKVNPETKYKNGIGDFQIIGY